MPLPALLFRTVTPRNAEAGIPVVEPTAASVAGPSMRSNSMTPRFAVADASWMITGSAAAEVR
jgi:hypothetical protein